MRATRLLTASLAALLLPATAHASIAIDVVCTGLAGCGAAPSNVIFNGVVPMLISILVQTAAGLSVVWVVIAGAKLLLSAGDESKTGAAKKQIMFALLGLALSITSASIVSWVTTENFGQNNPTDFVFGAGGLLQSVVRIILTVFNAAFLIMVIYGGFQMAQANGQPDGFKKGGQTIKWAIIGAIVVNLAKAIVQALLQVNL